MHCRPPKAEVTIRPWSYAPAHSRPHLKFAVTENPSLIGIRTSYSHSMSGSGSVSSACGRKSCPLFKALPNIGPTACKVRTTALVLSFIPIVLSSRGF